MNRNNRYKQLTQAAPMPSINNPSIADKATFEMFNRDQKIQKLKEMVVELKQSTLQLTRKDIGKWRQAWQYALNVDNPKREQLLNIYSEIKVDLHLQGAIGQRKDEVLQKRFKMIGADGEENKEGTTLLNKKWFRQFIGHAWDSRTDGFSLIQFGDLIKDDAGHLAFKNVQLIDRRHVIPEKGVFVERINDDWKKGYPFNELPFKNWCIGVGEPTDLGLLLGIAKHCISKKNIEAFWDGFAEIFGMPIRIGKTSSRNPKDRDDIEDMLKNMGTAAYGVFPETTTIDIKETTRGDAYEVYDKRIDKCDAQISKGLLRQTMTIDNGSSKSQSGTHKEIFDKVVKADCIFLQDIVNDDLLPLMRLHGFPVDGLRFEYDFGFEYSAQEQVNIESMLLSHFEVEPADFEKKYGFKLKGQKNGVNQTTTTDPEPGKKVKALPTNFFA